MARLYQFCFLLLLSSWYQACNAVNPFSIATVVIEKTITMVEAIQLFRSSSRSSPLEEFDGELYNNLNALSTDMQDIMFEIMNTISQDAEDKLFSESQEFLRLISDVQSSYEKFMKFLNYGNRYETATLLEFANVSTTQNDDELQKILIRLYKLFLFDNIERSSLLTLAMSYSANQKPTETMCSKSQSKHQLIHDLYEGLINATIKGLLISAYSYSLKAELEQTSFKSEQQEAIREFKEKVNEAFEHVKKALSWASREIWRCDPWQHIADVTYSKLDEIFQAVVVDDRDIADMYQVAGDDYSESHTCDQIKDARLFCTMKACKAQPTNKVCTGHLRDCQTMPSSVQLCYSDSTSERRYEWVKRGEKNNRTKCRNSVYELETTSDDEDICQCNCESENRKSLRYFSLLDTMADEDKVVTGAKLAKANGVFYIQIQQAALGENGSIIDETQWKDGKVISQQELLEDKVSVEKPSWVEFKKNNLVYSVTYIDNYVFLDTLDTEPNRLVTGMRFQQDGLYLKLAFRTTPFDYATGKLHTEASRWESSENAELDKRDEVTLKFPRNPTEQIDGRNIVSSRNKYVRFRMTDFDEDFGSYTVPFLDLREVTTNPPMPLVGAGLIHRGKAGSGGFLGLEIIHFDYIGHSYNSKNK